MTDKTIDYSMCGFKLALKLGIFYWTIMLQNMSINLYLQGLNACVEGHSEMCHHETCFRLALQTRGGGEHSNNSVVHMRDQRNTKKGLYFKTGRDLRESRLVVKVCLFLRKRVHLDYIKVRLGVIFRT